MNLINKEELIEKINANVKKFKEFQKDPMFKEYYQTLEDAYLSIINIIDSCKTH